MAGGSDEQLTAVFLKLTGGSGLQEIEEICDLERVARSRRFAVSYLLLPSFWASRNRARRRERGDLARGDAVRRHRRLS